MPPGMIKVWVEFKIRNTYISTNVEGAAQQCYFHAEQIRQIFELGIIFTSNVNIYNYERLCETSKLAKCEPIISPNRASPFADLILDTNRWCLVQTLSCSIFVSFYDVRAAIQTRECEWHDICHIYHLTRTQNVQVKTSAFIFGERTLQSSSCTTESTRYAWKYPCI